MDIEKLLGRLTDQERRAWNALEAERRAGASWDGRLDQQTKNAAELSEQVKDLKAERYHGRRR